MSDATRTPKPSRHDFLGVAAATGAAIAAPGGEAALEAQARGATPAGAGALSYDLFLTDGRIHTLDGTTRVVSRAHLRYNRIAALGNTLARPAGARVIDLKARTAAPGLVEPHVHIVSPAVVNSLP